MSAFPSSGFEVIQSSSSQLVVVCHYAWWYAAFAGIIFGLPALRSFLRGIKAHQGQPIGWGVILSIACFVAISTFPTGKATFDKSRKIVTFEKRGFLFVSHSYEYPLDQVRYATVETATASRRFVVVFKGGTRVGLSVYTSQGGQSQAVDAVNDFLSVSPN